MRTLLLGGTGAMGAHLTRLLSTSEVDLTVTSRQEQPPLRGVRYVQGNAHDMTFLQPLLNEQWDVIVDFMVYKTPAFAQRVEHLLAATKQYVFLSSARVYADSQSAIREGSPRLLDVCKDEAFLASDEYAIAKARQEDLLRNCGITNWTIIRPYITYSETRLQLGVLEKEAWLYRALKGRAIVFSSDIAEKVTTLTYGFDVAQGIRAILGQPAALGKAYHITATESLAWGEIISLYLSVLEAHLGYRPKVILTDLSRFRQCHPGHYQIEYDRLFNRKFDNTAIHAHLPNAAFEKPDHGLRHCLKSFLKNPRFRTIKWSLEAAKDRISKERTPLREIPGMRQKASYLMHRYVR